MFAVKDSRTLSAAQIGERELVRVRGRNPMTPS